MKYKIYVLHKATEVVSSMFVNDLREIDRRRYDILSIIEIS